MVQLDIDAMNDATQWSAFAPDGITPSTELQISTDATVVRFGKDQRSGRITASSAAQNHLLRRALPALDLSSFDEIRLWLWSPLVADGSAAQPFFLEVRLGSAAMGIQHPNNKWSRSLAVPQASMWHLARLDLNDLPGEVRSAVNQVQLRCISSRAFTCYLDDVLAVREEMIADVDAALLALLHEQISINATAVPAFFVHPENPPTAVIPSIRITQYDIQYNGERTSPVQARSDYSGNGFRLRPASIAYELYYAIDVYADTRQHKAQILEFVLRTIAPYSVLLVNGTQVPIEWATISPFDDTGRFRSDRELLYFKVLTRQEVGRSEQATPPYQAVTITVDQPA